MQSYIKRGRLQVAELLDSFIQNEALPNSNVSSEQFWSGFENIVADLMPKNQALLAKRDKLQQQLDDFCSNNAEYSLEAYKSFLTEIGYLEPQVEEFTVSTENVDAEIATMAGPQLVVPINNARYAINAANARWGSLYDAAYGTDVISEQEGAEKGKGYNPKRGEKVIKYARHWLDKIAPLSSGSHVDSIAYQIADNKLQVTLQSNDAVALANPLQLVGYRGNIETPEALILEHNGLHVELQFDSQHPIGKTDPTGLKDVLVEAALTTIMDCEDSVAAVDAEDKTLVYRNWLGLMLGTLSMEMQKAGKTITRTLAQDRQYVDLQGQPQTLSGRSLMFVRNVGHLMTNDAILFNGEAIPEGIMDGIITALIGKQDLLRKGKYTNSQAGSIYIVKPKMHGSEEVRFANTLFEQIEDMLGLTRNTIKIGIMDEERRTSVNLRNCIHAAKERVAFINTGFLDRTGDEIHTSMLLGPFALKSELKTRPWITAYELANVQNGLVTGLSGKAQIGKGMWPIPDNMADMMQAKIGHPKAGASTAWVPSPTAATLHALHYHQVNVFATQKALFNPQFNGLDDILTVPLMARDATLDARTIERELDNNVQGILGYVVRWVHQGIGCSKVPDINNVGLMEDRATLRISSQHIANWLTHNIVSTEQVEASMARMAKLVDEQNADDPEYIPMCPDYLSSIAFQAAQELVFKGTEQPNGYTEPVLHRKRREMKLSIQSSS